MTSKLLGLSTLLLALAAAGLGAGQSTEKKPTPLPAPRAQPKLEAVAETRLLMEGLMAPNFRGLETILKKRPDKTEPWTFARGQALLIAETANLLMLRPPHAKEAQAVWFARAGDLRAAAVELARSAAARDYEVSRKNVVRLANACNHCHQSFRKDVEVVPFEEAAPK
jgi:cytochrome c556